MQSLRVPLPAAPRSRHGSGSFRSRIQGRLDRLLGAVLLPLILAGSASAASSIYLGSAAPVKPVKNYSYLPPAVPRQGGDTIENANPIAALPYTDYGTTDGYINNYDEVCPYAGSTSPDVVYRYTPAAAIAITADLCASAYDTKLYIYAGAVGNLVACSDDAGCGYSGYQSRLDNVALTAGITYYIVIDGYGGAYGQYQLNVTAVNAPPPFQCPPNAYHEGEPSCETNYVDNYNGGCNATPNIFQPVDAQAQGCADMCGYSCTYLYNGQSYRDTDWFESVGTGGTVSVTALAEFPLLLILIYGTDCANPQYVLGTAPPNTPITLSHFIAAGAPLWTWVGPNVFNGVPPSQYRFHICGIQDCAFHAARMPATATREGGAR